MSQSPCGVWIGWILIFESSSSEKAADDGLESVEVVEVVVGGLHEGFGPFEVAVVSVKRRCGRFFTRGNSFPREKETSKM